jgi:hypothetical protein
MITELGLGPEWAGRAIKKMGRTRNVYTIFVEKCHGKMQLSRE